MVQSGQPIPKQTCYTWNVRMTSKDFMSRECTSEKYQTVPKNSMIERKDSIDWSGNGTFGNSLEYSIQIMEFCISLFVFR